MYLVDVIVHAIVECLPDCGLLDHIANSPQGARGVHPISQSRGITISSSSILCGGTQGHHIFDITPLGVPVGRGW